MNISDDEQTLQKLEEEKAAIEIRQHNGYTDAARYVRLKSEIDAIEYRIARNKERAQHGQG